MFPTLKQGVIAGVFKIKGASSWAIIRAGKIQVSVFLPNEHSMDDWYTAVYALPTVVRCLHDGDQQSAQGGCTTFTTCGRSMEYLVCGAMFARGGGYCSSTSRPFVVPSH